MLIVILGLTHQPIEKVGTDTKIAGNSRCVATLGLKELYRFKFEFCGVNSSRFSGQMNTSGWYNLKCA